MSRDPVVVGDVRRDRAVGALLGTAVGDALAGAGDSGVLGEWSHPTAMAIAVAEFAATGADLCEPLWQDRIVERWAWWARTAPDVGPQTEAVLSAAHHPTAVAVRDAAAALFKGAGRSLDGSCLTRAVPASLGGSQVPNLCELTHAGPDAIEACQLWERAIRHAIITGSLDIRVGLLSIGAERQRIWESRLAEAERSRPSDFADGRDVVVSTFQAAWSAIANTSEPIDDPAAGVFAVDRLRLALASAATAEGDTHSVAAAAGGLLGAAYGASAIPAQWRHGIKGWPGLNGHLLVGLMDKTLTGGEPRRVMALGSLQDCPAPEHLPHDEALWIGGAARLAKLPEGTDAVVSLCPLADEHVPAGFRHLEVPLIDEVGANPNLDFVLLDTVRSIERLRGTGATVFLHGRGTHGRAPTVAALYAARRAGITIEQALAEVCALLPGASPNREFRAALSRLHPTDERAPR